MDIESAAFQFKGKNVDSYRVKILGIRDYLKTDSTETIYNDLICLLIDNQIDFFEASTDPGSYYINHPVNPHGCARLKTGLWWYQRGLHLNVHHALVQCDDVEIDRLDKEGKRVISETGYFGINIHSGGSEIEVGRFSAGCQVIRSPEGAWDGTWIRFYGTLRSALEEYKQFKIPYLLVDSLKAIPESI